MVYSWYVFVSCLVNNGHSEFALLNREVSLWHRRLGHPCAKVLSKVPGIIVRSSDNVTVASCGVCAKAKQKKHSYDSSRKRASAPLEIIHTDIIGPMSESVEKDKYIVTFLDGFAHYAVTFAMKNRSDVGELFINYERKATAKFNRNTVTVRCDNAPEYIGGKFRDHCNERGITLQPAEPYDHQHNGTAEGWNRTLREKMLALLYDSKLPTEYWNYACYAATYLLNRLPSTTIEENKTPYELWNGTKPNLDNLKLFGCVARTLIPYEKRTKLQPKSRDMILVGYCDTGYVVLDPVTKETQLTSNVECDETKNFESFGIRTQEEIGDNGDSDQVNALLTLDDNRELTYEKATTGPESKHWKRAIKAELDAMTSNNVWTPIQRESIGSMKVIDMRWVFRKKQNPDGGDAYKARLVARGYKDNSCYEISEIYAPTATVSVIRALISLAVNKKWPLRHFDISNAFLNGEVSREIVVKPPEGASKSVNIVYKLNRSLYGLKSAPKSWNDTLHKVLLKAGLKRSKSDSCLYVFGGNDPQNCIVIVYVDDLLVTGNDENVISSVYRYTNRRKRTRSCLRYESERINWSFELHRTWIETRYQLCGQFIKSISKRSKR